MDFRRLRAGEWVLGGGSALLLISLFTGWYEVKNSVALGVAPSGDYTLTAFEAFSVIDVILAGGALLGLGLVSVSAQQRVGAVSIAGLSIFTSVAALLLALVLFRAARIPDFELDGGTVFEATRSTGVWLALAGSGIMLAASLAALRDERITGDTRSVDPADIETLAAPRP